VDIAKILRRFMIYKFIKFIVVGFSGLIVDFSITFLLKEKFKIHRYIANSAGFISAASSNYLFNRLWTFESKNPEVFTEYGTFILISLIGLVINNFFLYVFEKKLNFYFAKFLAIMVTSIWNFTANYYLNFNH
jgi:putative flippase GtrA